MSKTKSGPEAGEGDEPSGQAVGDKSGSKRRPAKRGEVWAGRKPGRAGRRKGAGRSPAAEARLSLRMLAQAIESTAEPIYITDLDHGFIFVNRAFEWTYRYVQAEVLGQPSDMLLSPKTDPVVKAELRERTRTGSWSGEVLCRRKDGTEFPGSLQSSQIRDHQGKVIGFLGLSKDLSEQKAAEQHQLKVAETALAVEARYRRIFDNAAEGIFQTTPEGRLLRANRALARIFGYASAEEMTASVTDVGRQLYLLPEQRTELKSLLLKQGVVEGFQAENYRKDGSRVWVSLNAHLVRNAAGVVQHFEGTVQDITEHKRLERELLEISASERRRIGRDLHDGLGQYLAGIAFRAKALEQTLAAAGSPHTERAKELTTLISNAIRQTRSVARGLNPVQVETSGLVPALQNLASEVTEFFKVSCSFQCVGPAPQVEAQAALSLYRLTQEAIHNAIRHGEAQRIEIELTRAADFLCLRIQDDGLGFTVPAKPQTGMGLRAMDYRARAMGGKLSIRSQLRRGTQVRCEVPLSLCLTPAGDLRTGPAEAMRPGHGLPLDKNSPRLTIQT
jgi:PAS domain S-box-containing protein